MTIRALATCTLVVAIVSLNASAHIGTLDGTEADFWHDHALVLMRVSDVAWVADGDHILHGHTVAVLYAQQAVGGDMSLRFDNGGASAITGDVNTGDLCVICLQRGRRFVRGVAGDPNEWWIPPPYIDFMPSISAIQKIKDLDDPLLRTIIDKVAAAHVAWEKKVAPPWEKEKRPPPDDPYWHNRAVVAVQVSGTAAEGGAKNVLQGKVVSVLWTRQLIKEEVSLPYAVEPGSALAAAKFKPQEHETYVLLLEWRSESGKWEIPSGTVGFFPSGCAVQKIKGLDDPLVKTIADKLAAARATTTQPATQPSGK
jgi:hypothetical protein